MDTQQQATASDPNMWQLVSRWADDLMQQQVPGSVVILIVLVALAPLIGRLLYVWWRKR
jgi:hypothetical protein